MALRRDTWASQVRYRSLSPYPSRRLRPAGRPRPRRIREQPPPTRAPEYSSLSPCASHLSSKESPARTRRAYPFLHRRAPTSVRPDSLTCGGSVRHGGRMQRGNSRHRRTPLVTLGLAPRPFRPNFAYSAAAITRQRFGRAGALPSSGHGNPPQGGGAAPRDARMAGSRRKRVARPRRATDASSPDRARKNPWITVLFPMSRRRVQD